MIRWKTQFLSQWLVDPTTKSQLRVKNQSRDCNYQSHLDPQAYTDGDTLSEFDYTRPVKPLLLKHIDNLLPSFNDSDNLIKLGRRFVSFSFSYSVNYV